MSAYEIMRFDDLRQEQMRRQLTHREKRELAHYWEEAEREYRNQKPPQWYGGDYPDVF